MKTLPCSAKKSNKQFVYEAKVYRKNAVSARLKDAALITIYSVDTLRNAIYPIEVFIKQAGLS